MPGLRFLKTLIFLKTLELFKSFKIELILAFCSYSKFFYIFIINGSTIIVFSKHGKIRRETYHYVKKIVA